MPGVPKEVFELTSPLLNIPSSGEALTLHFHTYLFGTNFDFYEAPKSCPCWRAVKSVLTVEERPLAKAQPWEGPTLGAAEALPAAPNPRAPDVWRAEWKGERWILKPFQSPMQRAYQHESTMLTRISSPFYEVSLNSACYLMLPDGGKDLWHYLFGKESRARRKTPTLLIPRISELWGDKVAQDPSGIYQFASALLAEVQKIHANGVLHRDLKPENILISDTGVVSVIDFGLATEAGSKQLGAGSPDYEPPESNTCYQKSGDVYQVGCVLAETLTGQRFMKKDTGKKWVYISHDEAITRFNKTVSDLEANKSYADIIKLIRQLLSKDPNARPTCLEAMSQIMEHLGEEEAKAPEVIGSM